MFFSQRDSIFLSAEAENLGGWCSPLLAVQGETIWPTVKQVDSSKKCHSESQREVAHIVIYYYILLGQAQPGGWTYIETDGQTASMRHHTG